MSTEEQKPSPEPIDTATIANPLLRFLIGAGIGTFVAWIPISIAVYSTHTEYHLSHYLALSLFGLAFGWLAVVQKDNLADMIERVLNSITLG
ncbi:MAG TPA: hypothetical protein VL134_07910 [Leptolyngbya sp.]|jgi:hypothetical protein|nr:hypothetical protein [Leptolyngbya sp.]